MVDADGRDQSDRRVAAPDLRETADIWFDTGRDPVVTWDPAGTHFELLDPGQPTSRITLLRVGRPAAGRLSASRRGGTVGSTAARTRPG